MGKARRRFSLRLGSALNIGTARAGFTYRLKPRASRSKGACNKWWYA